MSDPLKVDFGKEIARGTTVHSNMKLEVIVIPTDKARIHLTRAWSNADSSTSWIGPLSVMLTLIIALVTTDFHDVGFVSKDLSKNAFILGVGASGIWFLRTACSAWRRRRRSKTGDAIEDIVIALKSESLCEQVDVPIATDNGATN